MITIRDIAKATGRSTATVDRVLNNRPGVREPTRRAILKAAAALKYTRSLPAELSLDFVFPSVGGFMRGLAERIQHENTKPDCLRQIKVHSVDYASPERLVSLLASLRGRSAGVGLVALDQILIREALSGLIERNIPVVTLLTDISSLPHQGYVGIDNRLAGRLAGHLIGKFLPVEAATIALYTGSRAYRGHEEREMGFRSVIRENFPHLRILYAQEIGESDQAGFEITQGLLQSDPGIAGIYNIGAGTDGIARALQNLHSAKKPVFIAHDLSVDTRQHLLSGALDAIIDQNAELTAQRAISRLLAAADQQMLGVCDVIDSRIIFMENIPQK